MAHDDLMLYARTAGDDDDGDGDGGDDDGDDEFDDEY